MTPRGRRARLIAALGCLVAVAALPPAAVAAELSVDLASARRLFQKNLDAIRHRDRSAYLACYLNGKTLARTGPDGIQLGFAELAREAGKGWPDRFEGLDLQLVPIRPGLVYGTYRYRVRYGAREESGLSERLFVETEKGWKIAVTTAFPAAAGTPPPPRALVGATLVDGTGGSPVADATVILRGGKIDCAGSRARCLVPDGLETLDVSGKWITPGLIDAHVHFAQTGWVDGRPDAIDVRKDYPYEEVEAGLEAHPERFFRAFLCSGVTAVFDVGGYPWSWDLRGRAAADPLAPRVAAAGPLLSTWDFWLNLPGERQFLYLGGEEDARQDVRYLKARDTDAVKVWFIPVESRKFEEMEKVVQAAGEEARRLRVPLIVHATGLREAKAALRAGASLLVHSVGDLPVDEEFLALARKNKVVYCPTLVVVDGYRRLQEAAAAHRRPDVDDPNGCVDPGIVARLAKTADLKAPAPDPAVAERRRARFQTFAEQAPRNLLKVHDAGIAIAMGTDAGNPLTLHGPSVYAEMEAMQAAGLAPMDVIVASTRGGARAMGRSAEIGTLEKGKSADLLVLDADPTQDVMAFRRLRYVVRGGVVRTPEELRPAKPAR